MSNTRPITDTEAAIADWIATHGLEDLERWPMPLWELRNQLIRERASAELDDDVEAFLQAQAQSRDALKEQERLLKEKHSPEAVKDAVWRMGCEPKRRLLK
jgi:hypothetical protein